MRWIQLSPYTCEVCLCLTLSMDARLRADTGWRLALVAESVHNTRGARMLSGEAASEIASKQSVGRTPEIQCGRERARLGGLSDAEADRNNCGFPTYGVVAID